MSCVWISHLQSTLGDYISHLSHHRKPLLISKPRPSINVHFTPIQKILLLHFAVQLSGHSFPRCSYILEIVAHFPRNSCLIGPLGLISFQNGVKKKSFLWKSNACLELEEISEGRRQNTGRAFVVCASSSRLCGGCQRLAGRGGASRGTRGS